MAEYLPNTAIRNSNRFLDLLSTAPKFCLSLPVRISHTLLTALSFAIASYVEDQP